MRDQQPFRRLGVGSKKAYERRQLNSELTRSLCSAFHSPIRPHNPIPILRIASMLTILSLQPCRSLQRHQTPMFSRWTSILQQ